MSTSTGHVRYIANGDTIYGHQFGFIKNVKNCSKDILWITWLTYVKEFERYEGSDTILQMLVGSTKFQIEVPFITSFSPYPDVAFLVFSNFLVDDKFTSLLETGEQIQVILLSPKDLFSKFDITTDTFNLNGFSAARTKAEKLCEGM